MDNGWALSLLQPVIIEFDKSIVDFPSIKRIPGGASNDQIPDLQNPTNPVPNMDLTKPQANQGGHGGLTPAEQIRAKRMHQPGTPLWGA